MYKAIYSKGLWTYWKGEKEITREEYEAKFPPKQWNPEDGCPYTCGDVDDFTGDQDKRTGVRNYRYFPQLARFPGDKAAHFSHVDHAVEAAKKRGYTIERD